ncbi:MAG TPA: VCBS repeat-containing protein [Ktedonobacteraceae bacterium]|nr:VCBS repeat-containing protein [Ktedonobacteraceae bacterium]
MPTSSVETEEPRAPRSALRYRPILGTPPVDIRPVLPRASQMRSSSVPSADVQEPSGPEGDEDADLEESVARAPSSQMAKPPRADRTLVYHQRRWRLHPLFSLGGGLLVMLLLLVLVTQAITWGTNALNTLRYGYPRVSQINAVVGHTDSASHPSHFLAINLNGLIEVIEWPGGESSHMRVYTGPQLFGPDSDQQPVTLRFADVNGDGKPDMLLEVEGSQMVWINDQGGFRPLSPHTQAG